MPVFHTCFYKDGRQLKPHPDHEAYRAALAATLRRCATRAEREAILRAEVVEITRHVTDGIRDVVTQDKRVRRIVLDEGGIPLASWAEMLDTLAEQSMPGIRRKIAGMARDLEQGRIQGFPGTMFLHGKPTFASLEGFYQVVFSWTEEKHE